MYCNKKENCCMDDIINLLNNVNGLDATASAAHEFDIVLIILVKMKW